ncbi:MAG: hypothetical protein ABIP06_02555 [Pyrinomonadaceae bacterium]
MQNIRYNFLFVIGLILMLGWTSAFAVGTDNRDTRDKRLKKPEF